MPRLSIIVPIFNVEEYVEACLQSIQRQTMDDFEAILIDDGSTDRSGEIAAAFVARDRRFRLQVQDQAGVGPARNLGMDLARGEHLAFVDADDLVARHAYELMIATLERTGSDLVASSARRFSDSGTIRPSWAHRQAFQATTLATHITRAPLLALDRTVWNKVFRRGLLAEHGYRFEPIACQDIPVSLAAHLDAEAVDVLAAPLYYWRERDVGTSETQQYMQVTNLSGRVRAAELQTGLVESAPPDVKRMVHRLLAEVDLAALMRSFMTDPDPDLITRLALARRLLALIDPDALLGRPPLERLQMEAVRAGDAESLRELAVLMVSAGPEPQIRRRAGRPWILDIDVPAHLRPDSSPDLLRIQASALPVRSRVTGVTWRTRELTIDAEAHVARVDAAPGDRPTLFLHTQSGARLMSVPTARAGLRTMGRARTSLGFRGTIDLTSLRAVPLSDWPLHLELSYDTRAWHRRDPLGNALGEPTAWWAGAWLDPGVWLRLNGRAGGLALVRITSPVHATHVSVDDAAILIVGEVVGAGSEGCWVEVGGKHTASRARFPIELDPEPPMRTFSARIPLAAFAEAPPDDPVSECTTFTLHLVTADTVRPLYSIGALGGPLPPVAGRGGITVGPAEDMALQVTRDGPGSTGRRSPGFGGVGGARYAHTR